MANPGPFQLISNDGKIDRLLQDTEGLKNRINYYFRKFRKIPSLEYIERTHILFPRNVFKPFVQITHYYERKGALKYPSNRLGNTVEFNIDQIGDFISDMAVYVRFGSIGDENADVSTADRYKYCEYPGIRLFKNIDFSVNGNPISNYRDTDVVLYNNFQVPKDRRVYWNRCVGQDNPITGELYLPQPQVDECRLIKNGAQTFKTYQPALEMYIPLLFWFCEDPKLCLPSIAIPEGQRRVKLDLTSYTNIIQAIDSSSDPIDAPTLNIEAFDLFINNFTVNPEIKDLYLKKIGFYLIRVHRSSSITLEKSKADVKFPEFKLPIETIYFGFRPLANLDNFENWYKLCVLTQQHYCSLILTKDSPGPGSTPSAAGVFYNESSPVIDKIGFGAYGIELYKLTEEFFYRAYQPFRFQKCCQISSPENSEECAYVVSWAILGPKQFQPSGYLNISRLREFKLAYESSYINPETQVELMASAIGINFLLISDGTAGLRYIS